MSVTDTYQLKLAVFEGPFDLLLYLIKKNQIDIYDIPIASITEEYLAYLEMMRKFNLNIASEFIIIASTLLYIKSKMLLPRDELLEGEEEDPRLGLVQHLIEYSMFKEISERMRIYEQRKRELFERLRPINIAPEDKELELDLYALVKAMDGVLDRVKERKMVVMAIDQVKVRDRMYELIAKMRETGYASFFALCTENNSRLHIVALFLAILELLRLRVINVFQEEMFGDIKLVLIDRDVNTDILKDISE